MIGWRQHICFTKGLLFGGTIDDKLVVNDGDRERFRISIPDLPRVPNATGPGPPLAPCEFTYAYLNLGQVSDAGKCIDPLGCSTVGKTLWVDVTYNGEFRQHEALLFGQVYDDRLSRNGDDLSVFDGAAAFMGTVVGATNYVRLESSIYRCCPDEPRFFQPGFGGLQYLHQAYDNRLSYRVDLNGAPLSSGPLSFNVNLSLPGPGTVKTLARFEGSLLVGATGAAEHEITYQTSQTDGRHPFVRFARILGDDRPGTAFGPASIRVLKFVLDDPSAAGFTSVEATLRRGLNSASYGDLVPTGDIYTVNLDDFGTGDYEVEIRAVATDGDVLRFLQAPAFRVLAPPGAPRDFVAVAGPGASQINLSWQAPESGGANGYRVHRATASGGPFVPVAELGNVLTYVDAGLGMGSTYNYRVSAATYGVEGPLSEESSATTFRLAGAPQNVVATTGPGPGQITLDWSAPEDDGGSPVSNYRVYQSPGPDGPFSLAATFGPTTFTWTLMGLPPDQPLSFKVAAVTAAGEGTQSPAASATSPRRPDAPSGLTATAGIGQITLAWSVPAYDGGTALSSYTIYRSATSGGPYSLRGQVPSSTRTWVDSGLDPGETWWYQVTAANGLGAGPPSAATSATTFAPPTAPEAPSASPGPGSGQITISWSSPSSDGGQPVTAHNVYRASSAAGPYSLARQLDGTTFSWTDTAQGHGQTRWYKIAAVNAVGEGPFAGPVSAKTLLPPSEPLDVRAQPGPVGTTGQIVLTWRPPDFDGGAPIASYRILRSHSAPGPYTTVTTVSGSVQSFTDEGLKLGEAYWYRVYALNGAWIGNPGESSCMKPSPWLPELNVTGNVCQGVQT